jgi:CheY-like chemotaxis protein
MKRILIVDEDTRAARTLAARLREAGFESILSCDPVAAVVVAAAQRPDLILLSLEMPIGRGVSLMDRLRGTPQTAGIPLIVLTASNEPGLRELVMARGAVGFFGKDCDADQLAAVVTEIAEETPGANEQAA